MLKLLSQFVTLQANIKRYGKEPNKSSRCLLKKMTKVKMWFLKIHALFPYKTEHCQIY